MAPFRVLILSTAFVAFAPAQDFSKISIEIIGKNFVFTEGPAWSKDGLLIFSDTASDKLWKSTPGSDAVTFREPSNGARYR